jgi:PAN domain
MPACFSIKRFLIVAMSTAMLVSACSSKKSAPPQRATGTLSETGQAMTTAATPPVPPIPEPQPSPPVQELTQLRGSEFTREDNTTINEPATRLRYFRLSEASLALCQSACAEDPDCVAFTYVRPDGYQAGDPPMCYLMASLGPRGKSTCCVTGVKIR